MTASASCLSLEGLDRLRQWPGADPDARAAIRAALTASGSRLAVVDDDPTGTQTVSGVPVCLSLDEDSILETARGAGAVFYVSTNSRSLPADAARELSVRVGQWLARAASDLAFRPLLASRSDSTLRGHYPLEVEALAEGLGSGCDGVIIAPAFFEGGRFTVDDVHLVQQEGALVPADRTEFARDPVFGYSHGNLREWVEEKTQGRWSREQVLSISLDAIREGGPEAVADVLLRCRGGQPVVVNAVCYGDLDTFVLGLMRAEEEGRRYVYRCSASFVKSRGGFPDVPLLTAEELCPSGGAGLVVAGSYVRKTSRQLGDLIGSGLAEGVEVSVEGLLDPARREDVISSAVRRAEGILESGRTALIYTSRARLAAEGDAFLAAGESVMSGLCGIVEGIRARTAFVVAKGGITSIEVARRALRARICQVAGQVLPGVPVWTMGPESRWPGVSYTVFPGNVGDECSLTRVVSILSGGASR